MKKRITGFWRTLVYNVRYKDGYFKKVMVTISILIIINLGVLLWLMY